MKKSLFTTLACSILGVSAAFAAYTPKYEIIDKPEYETTDVNVISYNILDYDADANKGTKDVTKLIQNLLNAAGDAATYPTGDYQAYRQTGGVVYLPEGKYKVKQLLIPRGVTIRGDWKKPVKGQPITGTILVSTSDFKGQTDETKGLIIMEPSTQVSNLSIWYPDQDANNVSAYPPSIVYGKKGYFGNDYCNTRNVTLVNSYVGLIFSELNGGGCPNIFGLYGTPLHKGVAMDNIADVGRFDHIDFSPKYWAGSGLDNAGDATNYTYNNGTAFEMRRNDWSYCCNFSAEGYKKGFWAKSSPETMNNQSTGSPNGQNYNLTFTNCKTGVYVSESAGCGIMFTRVKTPGCEVGLEQVPGQGGPGQYLACNFTGSVHGVYAHFGISNLIQLQQCNVTGGVKFDGGELIADNCVFDGDVEIGAMARCIFTANTVKNGEFKNASLYACKVDHNPRAAKPLPEYGEELMSIPTTKPAKIQLFVATEYGAEPLYIVDKSGNSTVDGAKDNTPAIQAALNAAKAAGGGIVYLPSGHYRCNGNLVVPTGVELRGSADMASTPRGQGAVLEVMVGEGSATGTPFITMEPKSGIRGVSVNYPKQDASLFTELPTTPPTAKCTPKLYPYAVRGNADCYIVNLAVRTCYQGVDLFTNKCDNHYVDYISGHCFKNVIRVGGNSENGTISNIQCNTIAFGAGDEWKFGLWPNSMQNKDNKKQDACYQQNYDELEFFIVGDCKNENLYNNFLFGSNIGILFQSDGNGGATFKSMGNAVDGVVNTFVFEQIAADAAMINSQLVALNNKHEAYFFRTEDGFNKTVDMFSTNNWGGGNHFAQVKGGTVNFICATLQQSGTVDTWTVSGTGKFNLINGNFKESKKANANKNVTINSAIYSPAGSTAADFGAYNNVLPRTWEMINKSGFKERTGWHATAFRDVDGQNENGEETLDDWKHAGDDLASRGIDGDPKVRWSSKGSQYVPGWYDKNANDPNNSTVVWDFRPVQYYSVYFSRDLSKKEHINAMILDSTEFGTNDGPAEWKLQVIDYENGDVNETWTHPNAPDRPYTTPNPTGKPWRTVSKGKGAGALCIALMPEEDVTGIRVTQWGQKGNYWSIGEAYVAYLEGVKYEETGVGSIDVNDAVTLLYADGTIIIASALFGEKDAANVEIYDMSGRMVDSINTTTTTVNVENLASGAYIARVSGEKTATLKFAVR